jgi:hypothetical protein
MMELTDDIAYLHEKMLHERRQRVHHRKQRPTISMVWPNPLTELLCCQTLDGRGAGRFRYFYPLYFLVAINLLFGTCPLNIN